MLKNKSFKIIFFKSYFLNNVSLILAYLFGDYEDITVQSANVAVDCSPVAVIPVSGVYIGVFDEEQTEADHDAEKEF